MEIEINEQFKKALEIMENSTKSLFLTGKAGTGKSTLLEYFRDKTRKKIVVLAPTGVAALNVRGQTIHSFFMFPPHITPAQAQKQSLQKKRKKLIQELDALVIDEISMVRADLLDSMDIIMRRYLNKKVPFGGIQMIFIGDLYQLPPVVSGSEEKELFRKHYQSPYFFDSKVFSHCQVEFMELEKIYRQKDQSFINLLNKIRNKTIEEQDLKELNKRYLNNFKPDHDLCITLTPDNRAADEINRQQLHLLSGKLYRFHGRIEGDFQLSHLPTAIDLELKQGAQVMLLNNDSKGRWVNGSLGKITGVIKEKGSLIVQLKNKNKIDLYPYTWELCRYFFNGKKNQLDVEIIGSFTQYPLRLAWAITIHKSQGKTFDNVVINMGRGAFTCGQTYVALSRCVNLRGIILSKPILKKDIWTDYRIVKFLTEYQYQCSCKKMSKEEKAKIIKEAIEKGSTLRIIYLKPNDEKSERMIQPILMGEMEYLGKEYLGIKAYCLKREENRIFRLDRILEMEEVK